MDILLNVNSYVVIVFDEIFIVNLIIMLIIINLNFKYKIIYFNNRKIEKNIL